MMVVVVVVSFEQMSERLSNDTIQNLCLSFSWYNVLEYLTTPLFVPPPVNISPTRGYNWGKKTTKSVNYVVDTCVSTKETYVTECSLWHISSGEKSNVYWL